MKKNLLLRLCLMISAILALSSCIHDEVYSAADPASTEYTNKTLWEQDEKYIKNVMTVYLENEKDIRKSNGVPFWDYATTVNNFDETFLMVPVVENKRVVSVLQVPRKGSKIHFYYSKISEQINFFQGLIFAKHTKDLFSENADTNKAIICTTQTIAVWLPNDESDPDPESGNGVWSPRSVVVCKEDLESCVSIINEFGECDGGGDGGDDNEDPGYDYPGEVEEPIQLPNPKDPCAKMKAQNTDTNFTSKITDLQGKTGKKKETGYIQRADGNYTYQDAAGQSSTSNTLSLPNPNLNENKNIIAYIHTHVDSYTFINADGIEETRTGIRAFSPADMAYFMDMIRNAQEAGRSLSDVYAVMVTSTGNYQIRFTGNQYQIKSFTKQQIENFTKDFPDFMSKYKNNLELGFLNFISEKMNIKATNLYKIEVNGTTIKEIKMNSDKTSLSRTDCPTK